MAEYVERGVSPFDGIFTSWYGWAKKGATYREGPNRVFKWRARLDSIRLARRLAKA
jgi:hypothetical protein